MTAASAAPRARADWPALLKTASAPYRGAGRFAWRVARGKLGLDPVCRHLLREALIEPNALDIDIDIDCGRGLLASLLRGGSACAQEGRWPTGRAAAPAGARVTGIALMPHDVQRARAALDAAAEFICDDMRHTLCPDVDTVVIPDVLHCITVTEQDAVLARVRQAVPAGGSLLLRVGDGASKRGFITRQWVDAVVSFVRGQRLTRQFGRTLAQWIAQLESLGFDVRSQPMSAGTPAGNMLRAARLLARLQAQLQLRLRLQLRLHARVQVPLKVPA